jgi:hypothetical protein
MMLAMTQVGLYPRLLGPRSEMLLLLQREDRHRHVHGRHSWRQPVLGLVPLSPVFQSRACTGSDVSPQCARDTPRPVSLEIGSSVHHIA